MREACIRAWRLEDAPELALVLNNPNIQDRLRDGIPYPYTAADAKAYISDMLQVQDNTVVAFAILSDEHVVGSIAAFRQGNIHSHSAEVGYYLAESHWGLGLGTSALRQLCEYLFRETDVIRIFAEPFSENMASCRILEKVGFQYEGTMRRHAVKNGYILDMKLYSLLQIE